MNLMGSALVFVLDHWPVLVAGGFVWMAGGLLLAQLIGRMLEQTETDEQAERHLRVVR